MDNTNEKDQYLLEVNGSWILLVHKCVDDALQKWSGGPPEEQLALHALKNELDRVKLEVMFDR